MGKYLKLFETHSQYTAFTQTEDFILPNVSYCKDQTDIVHYNPIVPPPLMVTYNVVDASQPTQLYFYNTDADAVGVDMFDNVKIDGEKVTVADLDAAQGKYQLSVGEHTVAYTLKDPTTIGVIPIDETTVKFNAVFMGCNVITSVIIPNSVTSIGDSAFSNCEALTSITIPDSVTTIGYGAFQNCSGLASVTIGNGVTSIGKSAFDSCSSLTSVTIPNSVKSIGNSAFYSCDGLTSVTIPNSVTTIGEGVFQGCRSLTSVTIPNSVTSIGDSAFSGCRSLTSVTIGSGVTRSIGNYAFCGCPLDDASIAAIEAINTEATICEDVDE